MKAALRVVVALGLAVGLSGCNLVVSEDPLFTAADAIPAPVLRDGLWLAAEPDCRVDEAKPAERWPDCADATFVRGPERWSMRWDDTDERGRPRRTFAGWESDNVELSGAMLAQNGDHLIVQDPPRVEEVGEAREEGEPPLYTYAAIRPVRHDDQGKVTAFEFWFVQCGPQNQPERSRDRGRRPHRDNDDVEEGANYVTDQPFPGLTVVENNCVATSVGALRNAAVLSEALAPPYEVRWVRDGWR
jgi:hypothetical protein